jgi:hypothetical protein
LLTWLLTSLALTIICCGSACPDPQLPTAADSQTSSPST